MADNLFIPSIIEDVYGPTARANQYGPIYNQMVKAVNKGSLIVFNYIFHKPGHDPYPLVLLTDVNYPQKNPIHIRGVNLHYLTFPTIKKLLQPNVNNLGFSYANIKEDSYISGAFRQYRRTGIRQLKTLNTTFLLNVLASVRSFNPNEIEAIRKSVREQLQRLTNPSANEMVSQSNKTENK